MLIKDLKLRDATPRDRPHLLLWDTPNDLDLKQLALYENAECVSYRDNLLKRTSNTSRFLTLHIHIARELDAIRQTCAEVQKPVLLLTDFDCLITYLYVQPEAQITSFWTNLYTTRHLQSVLWIILPRRLAPPDWEEKRMQYF
jgi:hypothetical protein